MDDGGEGPLAQRALLLDLGPLVEAAEAELVPAVVRQAAVLVPAQADGARVLRVSLLRLAAGRRLRGGRPVRFLGPAATRLGPGDAPLHGAPLRMLPLSGQDLVCHSCSEPKKKPG